MEKKYKNFLMLILFAIAHLGAIQSQVTIGSGNAPSNGTLLQLKENNDTGANSQKGFGLPRVFLTDNRHLYPMFKVGYNIAENESHEGLMVYNTNPDFFSGRGVYIWQRGDNDVYVWVSINTKVSVQKKLIAIISKASQTIPARGNGADPVTTGVTWNNVTGNNAQKIEIRNNTDIYLPPGKDIKITGYIGIESYLVGVNPTYIATRFALVENGGTTDPSKLILSAWGYVESSTETYDDGGASNPVCILNTGENGAVVRLIANGPQNDRNTVMAASTPLTNKYMSSIGTYLIVEEL